MNEESRASSDFRFEPDFSRVFLDDGAVRQSQALAGAFANLFGGKEGIEYLGANRLRYPASGVGDGNLRKVSLDAGAQGNQALVSVLDLVLDGVGGIDDQVENDLIQLSHMAGDQRQAGAELGFDFGDVFPLVAGHRDGGLDRLVDVDQRFFPGVGMGKLLHRPHNLGDALHSIESLFDGAGYLGGDKLEIFFTLGLVYHGP